ncbi:unnamed protein product, partial [Heterosigma akashiwo]
MDDLHRELLAAGFHISRQGAYLRLVPARSDSVHGRTHVKTVPVKLLRSTNDDDTNFCVGGIMYLEQLASLMGGEDVCIISMDDKHKVPLALAAADLQAPILMHLKYRVRTWDHNFPVADKHSLTSSVMMAIPLSKNGMGRKEAVKGAGPIHVAIRSAKHSPTSPFTHAVDLERICDGQIDTFNQFVKKKKGDVKPILMLFVDGGSDENPRYRKVHQMAAHMFKKYNLDAIYITTNAPGRSAFNRAERAMAPLSHDLSGLILEHDHFGSHLDGSGVTVDTEKEVQNFEYAGSVLAEVWSQTKFDGFTVNAQYIKPDQSELGQGSLLLQDQAWKQLHLRGGHYLLQIVKCENPDCCSPLRSTLLTVMPERFLPPLIPLCNVGGLHIPDPGNKDAPKNKYADLQTARSLNLASLLPEKMKQEFKILPFDVCAPSLQGSVPKRVCKVCGVYFGSQVLLKEHMEMHRGKGEHKMLPEELTRLETPMCILNARGDELLVRVCRPYGTVVEWLPRSSLDINGLTVPELGDQDVTPMPVITPAELFGG